MKVVLFPHAGSVNRGCEAIVRTTVAMLEENPEHIFLYSDNPESDFQLGLNQIVNVISPRVQKSSKKIEKLWDRFCAKISHEDPDYRILYRQHKVFQHADVAISIGGDNYCYPGMIHVLKAQCIAIDHFKVPRILWGCSVDENLLTQELIEHLKQYRAIFVRETVSQKILADAGIERNVFLHPDPAFTLKKQETRFQIQNGKPFIGLNISPLMSRFGSSELLLQNFEYLIQKILKETDRNIALIPHVFQKGNSDLDFMRSLLEKYSNDRVELIDQEYNSMQLKSLISQCEFFVGCRTHATIAAYSSCVPTLVIGYSNKSKGIARDLFGAEQDYVFSITDFKAKNDLECRFSELYDNRIVIKKHLNFVMKNYIPRAYSAGEKLKEIISHL